MTDVCEILGLEEPLFCDQNLATAVSLVTLPHQTYRRKVADQLDLHKQIQHHKLSVSKLEMEIESMRQLLQECKQLKLTVFQKKEYSQTFLSQLNKTKNIKEGELLKLSSKTTSSEHDKAKIVEQKKLKCLLEQLFGVKISTKYSNTEAVTLMIKKTKETNPDSSKITKNEKENYIQVENNSTGGGWMLVGNKYNAYENSAFNSVLLEK